MLRKVQWLALLAVVAVLPAPVSAQDLLRWKFSAGESLTYVVKQSTAANTKVGGQSIDSNMQQTMQMGWKIGQVASNGDAGMSQTVERVILQMSGGPMGEIKYDTASQEVPSNPMVRSMSEVFRKIVGKEFRATMKPTGEIQDVQVPDQLLQQLSSTAGLAQAGLNEEMLKKLMEKAAVILKAEPVAVGDSWQTSQDVDLPFGRMQVTSTLTYQGRDSQTGHARIQVTPQISIKPNEDAPLSVSLKKADGVGEVLFDVEKGRIVKSTLNLQLEMNARQFGQVVDQQVKQMTVMELIP